MCLAHDAGAQIEQIAWFGDFERQRLTFCRFHRELCPAFAQHVNTPRQFARREEERAFGMGGLFAVHFHRLRQCRHRRLELRWLGTRYRPILRSRMHDHLPFSFFSSFLFFSCSTSAFIRIPEVTSCAPEPWMRASSCFASIPAKVTERKSRTTALGLFPSIRRQQFSSSSTQGGTNRPSTFRTVLSSVVSVVILTMQRPTCFVRDKCTRPAKLRNLGRRSLLVEKKRVELMIVFAFLQVTTLQ